MTRERPTFDPATQGYASPHMALEAGCRVKEFGDFDMAERILETLRRRVTGEVADRAEAHLAHLDYYRGNFEAGRRRAERLTLSEGVACAEAHLYLSVNLIALNRSGEALRSAVHAMSFAERIREDRTRAATIFRVARQLVHVYVARGSYAEAREAAEAAARIAQDSGQGESRGVAAYLRGLVLAATGDRLAFAQFRLATEALDPGAGLGRWLLHVMAGLERNLGRPGEARDLHRASGVSVPWEDPLFRLAEGRECTLPSTTGVPLDELPFRQAAGGVIMFARGDHESSVGPLAMAVEEFARRELVHERRGASLALAAALLSVGDSRRAAELLTEELPALEQHSIQRWSWWHESVPRRLMGFALNARLRPDYWRWLAQTLTSQPQSNAASGVLARAGLTPTEASVVRGWMARPHASRRCLAQDLGMSDATLRNHINRIRDKLSCDQGRGLPAISRAITALVESSRTEVRRATASESPIQGDRPGRA